MTQPEARPLPPGCTANEAAEIVKAVGLALKASITVEDAAAVFSMLRRAYQRGTAANTSKADAKLALEIVQATATLKAALDRAQRRPGPIDENGQTPSTMPTIEAIWSAADFSAAMRGPVPPYADFMRGLDLLGAVAERVSQLPAVREENRARSAWMLATQASTPGFCDSSVDRIKREELAAKLTGEYKRLSEPLRKNQIVEALKGRTPGALETFIASEVAPAFEYVFGKPATVITSPGSHGGPFVRFTSKLFGEDGPSPETLKQVRRRFKRMSAQLTASFISRHRLGSV